MATRCSAEPETFAASKDRRSYGFAENIAIVVMRRSLPDRGRRATEAARPTVVHCGETKPEQRVRTVVAMAFHSNMSSDRPPMKPTPVKATPTKLTPPRQTPIKPLRT
jgi:hypothetical protein